MAGGMGRRQGPTLAERSGAPAPAADLPEARTRAVVRRHCWVDGGADHPGRWAGLLVEWRQAATGGWEGRVAYVVAGPPDRPVLLEAWLPADRLAPA